MVYFEHFDFFGQKYCFLGPSHLVLQKVIVRYQAINVPAKQSQSISNSILQVSLTQAMKTKLGIETQFKACLPRNTQLQSNH